MEIIEMLKGYSNKIYLFGRSVFAVKFINYYFFHVKLHVKICESIGETINNLFGLLGRVYQFCLFFSHKKLRNL